MIENLSPIARSCLPGRSTSRVRPHRPLAPRPPSAPHQGPGVPGASVLRPLGPPHHRPPSTGPVVSGPPRPLVPPPPRPPRTGPEVSRTSGPMPRPPTWRVPGPRNPSCLAPLLFRSMAPPPALGFLSGRRTRIYSHFSWGGELRPSRNSARDSPPFPPPRPSRTRGVRRPLGTATRTTGHLR